MAIIKCKMCGGDLNLIESASTAECEFCGCIQTIPKVDNEKKMTLFARANRLRAACEFDKAAGIYEAIVADFPEEAEAYWGLVLCKYGIEYVDDLATGKKIPTCHRSSFDSVLDDENFEQAQENADEVARKVYRDEAKQLEELRKGIIAVSANEEPYDIFICYKETDESGNRTLDSVLAQDIYDALTNRGYRVFFSRISLEDKLGQEYEPYIFAALNSAKVMLAIGTDYEYFNAVWVRNEWSRYLKLVAKDETKHLIPCFKGIDVYDLPKEFARLQAQNLGKVGAVQDLLRGVDKLLSAKVVLNPHIGVQTDDMNRIYIYNSAMEALKTNNTKSVREALHKFRELEDWMDAPVQRVHAEQKLQKLKIEHKIKCAVALVIFVILIITVFAVCLFARKKEPDELAQQPSSSEQQHFDLAEQTDDLTEQTFDLEQQSYDLAQWYAGNYEYRKALEHYEKIQGFLDADKKISELNQIIEEEEAALRELVECDASVVECLAYFAIRGADAGVLILLDSEYTRFVNGYFVTSGLGYTGPYENCAPLWSFFGKYDERTFVSYDSKNQEYLFVEEIVPIQEGETIFPIRYRGKITDDGCLYVYNDAGEHYTLKPDYYRKDGLVTFVD